jgi:iron complex outermembrane receptor protein
MGLPAVPGAPIGAPAGSIFEGDMVANNYLVRRIKAEGFLYARLKSDWNAKAGFGWSYNDGMYLNSTARNELRGLQVNYQTLQVSHPNWYLQVTRTADDAGNSYSLQSMTAQVQTAIQNAQAMGTTPDLSPAALEAMRQKVRIVDTSQMIDSELQYRNELWRRLRLTGGASFRAYFPATAGTQINDATTPIRRFVGGEYAQLDLIAIRDRLRVVGAFRADEFSDYGVAMSPKVAIVTTLAHNHNLRVGYNRAFRAPALFEAYVQTPSSGTVGNHTGFVIKDANGNVTATIPALTLEENNEFELGYRGDFAHRLFIDAVGYYSLYNNFIGPTTAIADGKTSFASYPDGTPTFAGTMTQGKLLTSVNFGKAQVAGADAGFDLWILRDRLLASASATYVRMVSFDPGSSGQKSLQINIPQWNARGSLTLTDVGLRNSFVRVQGRFQSAYQYTSGTWDSTRFPSLAGGLVPQRLVADVMFGYRFPAGVTLSATVFNVFDDRGFDVLGAPPGGIVSYVQITYNYSGLDY